MEQIIRINHMQAPQPGAFSLFFKTRFCRIWLADTWHIGMSRKGTCILSYPDAFGVGITRASPVTKKPERVPSRLSLQVGFLSLC